MAGTAVALDVENLTVKIESTRGSQSSSIRRQSASMELDGGRENRPTIKDVLDPNGRFALTWSKIFVISCAIAVSVDPLFFYIPIVNEEKKCVGKDTRLRTVALLLRSIADMTFIIHIIHELRLIALKRSPLSVISIAVDFLAILPIPQVAILLFFLKLNGSEYFYKRSKILNASLLLQCLPKLYRIHLSSRKLKAKTGKWAKGAFNFFLYILASHITGAFWYFFSIQRETSCWHRACMHRDIPTTPTSTSTCLASYLCDVVDSINITTSSRNNITFLNEKCPTNPTNATLFDFGVFSNALESGTTQSFNFPSKIFYSFWWALRNLSSFGQNLETSTYLWENGCAILICVMGLLLFIRLIGNVQTFMQLATIKSEEKRLTDERAKENARYNLVLSMKMQRKTLDILMWMDRNGIHDKDIKTIIMENVKGKFQENTDVDMENLFPILPWRIRKIIKHHLCMDTIKKVPMLQNADEQVLQAICGNLRQVTYSEGSFIVREGEPLDKMLFITQGIVWTYSITSNSSRSNGSSSDTQRLEKNDFYGEQLVNWAAKSTSFCDLPITTTTVKSHTKVEAFALLAIDLKNLVARFWWHFSKEISTTNDPHPDQWKLLAVSSIRRRRRSC